MKKIKNWFDNLSNKQKIAISILIMSIFLLFTLILKNFNAEDNKNIENNPYFIDYSKISTGADFEYSNEITDDRKLYWNINDIISNYINSFSNSSEGTDFTIDDYFDVLNSDYQNYLKKQKYDEIAKKFSEKFLYQSVFETRYSTNNIIESIYKLRSNVDMYLCKLKTNGDKDSYIGITLNQNKNTYEIFYVE